MSFVECQTISGPAGVGRDCVFPFTYKGKTYNGCPQDTDDRFGKHLHKVVLLNSLVLCQYFPVILRSVCPKIWDTFDPLCTDVIYGSPLLGTHATCVNANSSNSSKRWCSTRVDSNGVHVSGVREYGHCGPGCPVDCNPKSDSACRPVAHCVSMVDQNDIGLASCKQANGFLGLCCGERIKTNGMYAIICILPKYLNL